MDSEGRQWDASGDASLRSPQGPLDSPYSSPDSLGGAEEGPDEQEGQAGGSKHSEEELEEEETALPESRNQPCHILFHDNGPKDWDERILNMVKGLHPAKVRSRFMPASKWSLTKLGIINVKHK